MFSNQEKVHRYWLISICFSLYFLKIKTMIYETDLRISASKKDELSLNYVHQKGRNGYMLFNACLGLFNILRFKNVDFHISQMSFRIIQIQKMEPSALFWYFLRFIKLNKSMYFIARMSLQIICSILFNLPVEMQQPLWQVIY